MDEESLNLQIRKFLKKLGIQLHSEIYNSIKEKIKNGTLDGNEKLDVSVLLEVTSVELKIPINGEIKLQKIV